MVDVHFESTVVDFWGTILHAFTYTHRLHSGVMATIPSLLCTVGRHVLLLMLCIIIIMVYITYLNVHRLKMSGCI